MTTTKMHLTLSVPGLNGTSGLAAANNINANFELIDVHDHSSDKGTAIPTSGLNINADLPLNSFGLTTAQRLSLDNQGSLLSATTYPRSIQAYGGDLYWNDGAGNAVQITSGGSVYTAATGTITGMTAGVAASYSTGVFTFLRAASQWADLESSGFRMYDADSGATNYVRLQITTSPASSFSLTFPNALPSNDDSYLLTNTSGVMAWARGVVNNGSNSANQIAYFSDGKTLASKALTNGQLLIGSTGSTPASAALTGTSNQITVTNGAGSITLSTPQNIHTAATPTFAGLTLTGALSGTSASLSGTFAASGTATFGAGGSFVGALSAPSITVNTSYGIASTGVGTFSSVSSGAVTGTTGTFSSTLTGQSLVVGAYGLSAAGVLTGSEATLSGIVLAGGASTHPSYGVMSTGYVGSNGINAGFNACGVGSPSATDSESVLLSHDGTKAYINVDKAGTGSYRTFHIYNGGSSWFQLTSAGGINLPGLTASQVVATDSSKNLTTLAYAQAATASTLVQRNSSGDVAASSYTGSNATFSGTTTLNVLSASGTVTLSSLTASQVLATNGSKQLTTLNYQSDSYSNSLVYRNASAEANFDGTCTFNNLTATGTVNAATLQVGGAAITSGTFAFSCTNSVSMSSFSGERMQYIRVGNVAHVSGCVTVTAPPATIHAFFITLPTAALSNITAANQLNGVAVWSTASQEYVGSVTGNASGILVNCYSGSSISPTYVRFTFSYEIV